MNNKRICFITCVNNDRQYEECLLYINNLKIPEGYEIDCISIKEAECITSAYNAAINGTDAKYKVYLHQDTYIINKNFIYDMLNIFNLNNEIGMIGVAGAKTIPTNAIWWESTHKYGKVYESHTGKIEQLAFNNVENDYEEVKAIDGLIIITQYDLPWREDIFDGWHFYDVSQSVEFNMAGYKVVVPKQEECWCTHDCGLVNTKNDYEMYRNIFLDEYSKKIFPLVSILIPTYNQTEYLKEALESAINQTYKNVEIIIGDDSNNNETERLIKEKYLLKYNNIKYYHNKQYLGQFDNNIKLYKASEGQYINYLMDDNLFKSTKIEKMMNYFIQDVNLQITLVTSHRGVLNKKGDICRILGNAENIFNSNVEINGVEVGNFMLKSGSNYLGELPTVLFRKDALNESFGVYNGRTYGCNVDKAIWYNLLSVGRMVYINDVLICIREHDNEQRSVDERKFLKAIECIHEVLTAREKGFLTDESDFRLALKSNLRYCESIIKCFNETEANYDISSHIDELKDGCRKINELLKDDWIDNIEKAKELPLVSILIPTYNQTKFLKEALESAINQTYSNIEIIIGDDSTNDDVENFIKPYLEQHNNISYFKNEKHEMDYGAENIKKLFYKSNGEYINYLYHDDIFALTKIEKMMEYYLKRNDLSLVTSHRQRINESSEYISDDGATKRIFNKDTLMDGRELSLLCLENFTNYIGEATTVLIKKSLIKEGICSFNGNSYLNIGDLAMWFYLLKKGRAIYVSESLSYFRQHSLQNTHKPEIYLMGIIEWKSIIDDSYATGIIDNYESYINSLKNWFYLFNNVIKNYLAEYIAYDIKTKLKDCIDDTLDVLLGLSDHTSNKSATRIGEHKIKVVFFTQAPSIWASTESAWKAFDEDKRCEVQIVQLPFYQKDYSEPNQENIGKYLVQQHIPFKYWYDYNLQMEKPDVVFYQNSYDDTRPSEFSVEYVAKFGCKIAYIPYAFELLKKWPGTQKDYINVISESYLVRNCWKMFIRSNSSRVMYEGYSNKGNEHMIVTGHPKIDFVVNAKLIISDIVKKYDKISNSKVILWNPNIGEFGGEDKWKIHFDILSVIEKFKELIVIFRPHPLQLKKLKNNEQSSDLLFEKFRRKLNEINNIVLDESPDYRESFCLSDGLISCSSSLIFEYFATMKPIMHTPKAYEEELNDDGKILEYLYNGDSIKEIEMFFDNILKEQDVLKEKRKSVISEFIFAVDGKNGERIKEYVINELEKERSKNESCCSGSN